MSEIERQREIYEAACRVPSTGTLRIKWNDGSKRLSGNGFAVAITINRLDDAIDNIVYSGRSSDTYIIDDTIDDLIHELQEFKKTIGKDIHSPATEDG